jgi:5'-nucleotidase
MDKLPHILMTNDDGFDAQGLRSLVSAVKKVARVTVVAPAFEKSGASHSISLKSELTLFEKAQDEYAFDGTPVDCVHFAMRNLLAEKPDLVLSGINHGANLANDTLYSGTVGGALVGCIEGVPAMAVSLVDYCKNDGVNHFDTACQVVVSLLQKLPALVDFRRKVVNINVPNIPPSQLKGRKIASLGERIYADEFLPGTIPHTFRYNHKAPVNFGAQDSDVMIVQDGFASISVLRPSYYDQSASSAFEALLE